MAFLENFLNSLKYNDPYDDDEEFFDEEDVDDIPRRSGKRSSLKSATMDDDIDDIRPNNRPGNKVTPLRAGTTKRTANGMEVCVIKPTSFEDAREIADTLINNRTVVLNMEGLDLDIAQRILDFTMGATFAISGNFQKFSNYNFLITPKSVDISGDFQEIVSGTFDSPSMMHTKF